MTVESAVAYIRRMRADQDFRKSMNDVSEDEEASWAAIRAAGFDFTMNEFNAARDVLYEEHGITPL